MEGKRGVACELEIVGVVVCVPMSLLTFDDDKLVVVWGYCEPCWGVGRPVMEVIGVCVVAECRVGVVAGPPMMVEGALRSTVRQNGTREEREKSTCSVAI